MNVLISKGLDNLLSQYRLKGADSFGSELPARLEEATLQLEIDDKWSAQLTDLMAEALDQAAGEYAAFGTAQASLHRLYHLYVHGRAAEELESEWNRQMEAQSDEFLQSALVCDLEKAFAALGQGKVRLVSRWLELTEQKFLDAVARYEQLPIAASEVTTESVLSHRLLLDGIDCWLEAVAVFQEGLEDGVDQPRVRELAREGQKRLKFVESLKDQMSSRRYFVNFN